MPWTGELLMSLASMPFSLLATCSFVSSSAPTLAATKARGKRLSATRVRCVCTGSLLRKERNGRSRILPIKTAAGSVGSAAGMVPGVQLFHALARHVRIDLRRRDVAVAEQQLYHAEVGAVVQEMGG